MTRSENGKDLNLTVASDLEFLADAYMHELRHLQDNSFWARDYLRNLTFHERFEESLTLIRCLITKAKSLWELQELVYPTARLILDAGLEMYQRIEFIAESSDDRKFEFVLCCVCLIEGDPGFESLRELQSNSEAIREAVMADPDMID